MNVASTINAILEREGSIYTDNPNDPGGPTKYGITLATLSAWRKHECSAVDVMNLFHAEAFDIYLDRYFIKPGFSKVVPLSGDLAAELTDTGVNCGPAVAAIFLQRCLNAFNQGGSRYPDLKLDGDIGARTLSALEAFLGWRKKPGERVLIAAINCLQGERYIELAEKNVKLEDFTYGWIMNRVLEAA